MPFIVTTTQPRGGKLYIQEQSDGEHLWTPDKRKATLFSEAAADKVANDINAYASTPAEVEGVKEAAA